MPGGGQRTRGAQWRVLHASARQLAPLVIVGAGLIWATAAQAQYVVSNNNDSGPGSLRQAIMDADNAGAPNGVPNGATSRAPTAERPSCAISGECLVQATQFADLGAALLNYPKPEGITA